MVKEKLSVRNLEEGDIERIADYWLKSDPAFLTGMGVDLAKLPDRAAWQTMLTEQLHQAIPDKSSYCMIWQADGQAVGHSNINKIRMGEDAFLHLHLWNGSKRRKGLGTDLLLATLPHFFRTFHLETLFCEPYARNPAPNKVLEKLGFQWIDAYVTTPGWINFEQPVNRWQLSYARFCELYPGAGL